MDGVSCDELCGMILARLGDRLATRDVCAFWRMRGVR